MINVAEYRITGRTAVPDTRLGKRLEEFFARDSIFIEKTDKKGRKRRVDIKPMVAEVKRVLVTGRELLLS